MPCAARTAAISFVPHSFGRLTSQTLCLHGLAGRFTLCGGKVARPGGPFVRSWRALIRGPGSPPHPPYARRGGALWTSPFIVDSKSSSVILVRLKCRNTGRLHFSSAMKSSSPEWITTSSWLRMHHFEGQVLGRVGAEMIIRPRALLVLQKWWPPFFSSDTGFLQLLSGKKKFWPEI